MDFIGRFESLEADLCLIGGIGPDSLPVIWTENGKDYQSEYTGKTVGVVSDLYPRYIKRFNYEI